MKKALLLMVFSLNTFACMDLDLKNRSLKLDIHWRYAPFANVTVLENRVIYQSKKSPANINLTWEKDPYKLTAFTNITKPEITGEGKVILTKFVGENTKTGKVKEKTKLVQLENGIAKVKFYDALTGKFVVFTYKEISSEDWAEMDCPDTESEGENKILIL